MSVSRGEEAWQGEQYTTGRDFNFFAQMQAFRWLEVNGGINQGPAIYYDDVAPFQGQEGTQWFGMTLQPNQHLTQSVDYNYINFDRADTGADVFSLHIVNARTTYQFDKHFLLRFLAQYDSSAERVLTDFLASYELVPGTVFHAGYGSLYEKRPSGVDPFMEAPTKYQAVNRGLFFKASYLRRF